MVNKFQEYFLDANAHVPLHPKAAQEYLQVSQSLAGHGHPSAPAKPGRAAATVYETARKKIAGLLGVRPEQIVFTSTCTQACEWGLEIFNLIEPQLHTTCSPMEHPAVARKFNKLFPSKYFAVSINGIIQPDPEEEYGKAICIHAQNEIGTIQPLEAIKSKFLFSDMSQSLGKVPISLDTVDVAVFGAHKFGGPGGIGFLYLKNINHWKEFGTGSRYLMDRPGTPDVASVTATAVALEEAISSLAVRQAKMLEFQTTLESWLVQRGIEIIGFNQPRLPNTTFLNLPNRALDTVFKLESKGIYVGLGSACGSLHADESPLMRRLGRDPNAASYLRISHFGEYGEAAAKHVISCLDSCLAGNPD